MWQKEGESSSLSTSSRTLPVKPHSIWADNLNYPVGLLHTDLHSQLHSSFWCHKREGILDRALAPGVSGNDFLTFGNGNWNGSAHSQTLRTGMGMKISFPIFGNGNGNGKSIPEFWEREWDVIIPGNDREREWHRKIEWTFFVIRLLHASTIPYNWYFGENHD